MPRLFRNYTILSLFAMLLIACHTAPPASHRNVTLDEMVSRELAEQRVLNESFHAEAHAAIAYLNKICNKDHTEPYISAIDPRSKMVAMVTADLAEVKTGKKTIYNLTATAERYAYRFVDVISLKRTGDARYPFEGKCSVATKIERRQATGQFVRLPLPPPGFHLANQEETQTVLGSDVHSTSIEMPIHLLLKYKDHANSRLVLTGIGHHVRPSLEGVELPKGIEQALKTTINLCRDAAPTLHNSKQVMTLVYSVKEKNWIGDPRPRQ